MDPSKTNPREYLRQTIDVEIKSLEESIRVLRHRRNALAPVSSLPAEVISAIFSLLRLPGSPPLGGKPDHHLSWLHVTHVCHQWREVALNLSIFWSHIDFSTVSLAGATEMLSRARTAPLYLEARAPIFRGDGTRYSVFQNELQTHISRVRHLSITAESFRLRRTLEGFTSPAPALEYLSLSRPTVPKLRVSVPDTLFDATTPRLSSLELRNCNISWTSALLKGLKSLKILTPSASARPRLTIWLDALDEMPQLERLVLHSATPFAGPYPIEVKRTSTLPSLTHLDISAPAGDCALALAHLDLPALTWLCVTAKSRLPHGGDIHKVLRHVAQHAHGPQDIQPLQSVLIHGDRKRLDILAWPLADNDIEAHDKTSFLAAKSSARVALSVTSRSWYTNTTTSVLDSVVTTLPLDNLVTLTAQHHTRFNDEFWKNYAPQWPLLQRVRLAAPAARWFREALLGNSGRECPLLPSLKRLDLIDDTALSVYKTLRLCDTLMRRVEQGVPVEVLDLSTCLATSRAVQLLSEIVVDVLGPAETLDTKGQKFCTWISASTARGYFVRDEHSGDDEYSDDSYDDDNSHIRDDDLDWFESDIDDEVVEAEEEGGGEGERDEYSEIEED